MSDKQYAQRLAKARQTAKASDYFKVATYQVGDDLAPSWVPLRFFILSKICFASWHMLLKWHVSFFNEGFFEYNLNPQSLLWSIQQVSWYSEISSVPLLVCSSKFSQMLFLLISLLGHLNKMEFCIGWGCFREWGITKQSNLQYFSNLILTGRSCFHQVFGADSAKPWDIMGQIIIILALARGDLIKGFNGASRTWEDLKRLSPQFLAKIWFVRPPCIQSSLALFLRLNLSLMKISIIQLALKCVKYRIVELIFSLLCCGCY